MRHIEADPADDEWRQLGERLRRADPVLYEHVFAFLVMSIPEHTTAEAGGIQ